MSEVTTEYLLEQWGIWRRFGAGVPSYVSPALAMMRDNVGSTVASAAITDDDAGRIDKAVSRLRARDREMGEAIWGYFGEGRTTHRVALRIKRSETKTRQLIQAGIAWIDGYLDTAEYIFTA